MLEFMKIAENPDMARMILERRLKETKDASERAAQHYMLWEACQVCGDEAAALRHLDVAMTLDPVRMPSEPARPGARRLVVLNAPGNFQANAPVSFLLGDSMELVSVWISGRMADRGRLIQAVRDLKPDAVLIAIAEDERLSAVLTQAEEVAEASRAPVFNGGNRIRRVARFLTQGLLTDIPGLMVPLCMKARTPFTDIPPFPVLIRPVQSHAGKGLQRLEDRAELEAYVAEAGPRETYYVTRFVDFSWSDGLFRKYRVVFVNGAPFPVHLAIHDDWAVWYYNAGMEHHPERRAEEARFMQNMSGYFPARTMEALSAIPKAVGLDYFGLDFGVLEDGTLVVFEIETGMIVHDQDPPEIYPYKSPCIARIREAFEAMVEKRIAALRPAPEEARHLSDAL